jgi:uncharacterized protein YecA (UPF0149 family)
MSGTDPNIDPSDQNTARLVMAVGVLMNLLESLDDLGIEPKGSAAREAEAILQSLGPAAVTCALLQGSETLRASEHATRAVNLYAQTALQRRESFLEAFDTPKRRAIEQRESERSCSAERVLELFAEALAEMKTLDVLKRWGSTGGLSTLSDAVAAASRGEEVDISALEELARVHAVDADPEPEENQSDGVSAPLPEDLLQVVGSVLAGVGADVHMLDRVMAGVVIQTAETPEGYEADSGGTVRRATERIKRNDPCPCGSGRKFKKCCLA